MKQINKTILINSRLQNRFSLDSYGKNTFSLNHRTGILQNKIEKMEVESNSREFGSLEQILDYLKLNKIKSIKYDHQINTQFTASRILRENQELLDTLDDLKLYKWELTSKISSSKKYILDRNKKLTKNNFTHFALSISFKLGKELQAIEIGIGSIDNLKINGSGLKLRIKDIVKNNRLCKHIEFKEKIPVVLDSGDGGILFHEIIGHSLEADYIAQGISPFTINDIGKQIFPKVLTVKTIEKKDDFFSGIKSDDEGNIIGNTDLITNGILNKIFTDNYHSDLLDIPNSGSARVEGFTKPYQPRMHSLYIKSANYNPEEIIGSVKYGVFAKEFGEGRVFFSNNTFSLIVKESYLIENGKITIPLGTIILKGNISEVLNSVKMIGNDFRYDRGVSYCFKNGQTLNVRVGQPSIKIEHVIVSRV